MIVSTEKECLLEEYFLGEVIDWGRMDSLRVAPEIQLCSNIQKLPFSRQIDISVYEAHAYSLIVQLSR